MRGDDRKAQEERDGTMTTDRRQMDRGDFVQHVAGLVAQANRDAEARDGGLAARTGAGDPTGMLNLRPGGRQQQLGRGGPQGGEAGGQPSGYTTRGMLHWRTARGETIHDRISYEEAEKILQWFRGVSNNDMATARTAVRELHRERSVSLARQTEPMQVSSDELGGSTVPTQFVDEVIISLPQETPFADGSLITLFPMQSPSVTLPKIKKRPTTGGTTTAEGEKYARSNAEVGTLTLFARKQGVIIPVTEEMLEGTSIDLVRILAQLVAEELARQRNNFITNGSGAEEPEGVRVNPNVATSPWDDTDDQTSAKSVSNVYHDVQQRYRTNGIWLVHNQAIKQLRVLQRTDGSFYWTDGFAATPATLMGRPVFENPDIPIDLGGGSDTEVLFGDFMRGYVLGRLAGVEMQQDSSGEDWEADIIRMKWRERLDGKVRDENAFVRGTGLTLT